MVGYERGGATTAVEERPSIRYTQATMSLQDAQALERREQAALAADDGAAPESGGPLRATGAMREGTGLGRCGEDGAVGRCAAAVRRC